MKLFPGQNKKSATLALLLCSVFIFQVINRALFLHEHRTADGIIFIHAHPYNKSSDTAPFKSHHHSRAEYVFWGQYNLLFFSAIIAIAFIPRVISFVYQDIKSQKYFNQAFYFCLSRAPPSLF